MHGRQLLHEQPAHKAQLLLIALRLQLQRRHRLCARVEALYQAQDGADVGAEAQEEPQSRRRRGITPAVNVVGYKQDLAAKLLRMLK